jgi:[acyl-carrier-protein] S-malonyltransferase
VLAILAPGQGAQRQGFLTPWLTLDDVVENLQRHSDASKVDLLVAGTVMSDSDITDTAVAQPLIVAASLVTAAALPTLPSHSVLAGHSVGEFAAAAIGGALSEADAVGLVSRRGAAMAAASAATSGGMTAVLGGNAADVEAAVTAAGCVIANYNATGQVVAAGTREALDRLAATAPDRARLRPLAVAGAFHTSLMAPALQDVADAAGAVVPSRARHGVLSNADGALITNGAELLSRLVSQVCSPVRWDLCMRTLSALGVTATIELAPAGTLTALIRRELPSVTALALNTPDDLPAARELIEQHTAEIPFQAFPWQVIVAPAKGTVTMPDTHDHTAVAAGDLLVRVTTRTDALEIHAKHAGELVEWLVHDGDPVSEGQPIARVSAEVTA